MSLDRALWTPWASGDEGGQCNVCGDDSGTLARDAADFVQFDTGFREALTKALRASLAVEEWDGAEESVMHPDLRGLPLDVYSFDILSPPERALDELADAIVARMLTWRP